MTARRTKPYMRDYPLHDIDLGADSTNTSQEGQTFGLSERRDEPFGLRTSSIIVLKLKQVSDFRNTFAPCLSFNLKIYLTPEGFSTVKNLLRRT